MDLKNMLTVYKNILTDGYRYNKIYLKTGTVQIEHIVL